MSARAPWAVAGTEAEQIAHHLGGDVAFLRAEQGLFFARTARWPPLSPVLDLLMGIRALEPRRASWICRNRVFTTTAATPAAVGAVRLGARQLTAGVPAVDHGLAAALPSIDAGAAVPRARRASPEAEPALLALVAVRGPLPDDHARAALACDLAAAVARLGTGEGRPDNPVAALLLGPAGDLLGWAASTGGENTLAHAECNAVRLWLADSRRRLPEGTRLVSSLKPCALCAGVLWEAAADPWSLQVLHAEDDRRRYARDTVLDAGSMARRRVARTAGEVGRRLLQSVP